MTMMLTDAVARKATAQFSHAREALRTSLMQTIGFVRDPLVRQPIEISVAAKQSNARSIPARIAISTRKTQVSCIAKKLSVLISICTHVARWKDYV
jgi:hypothetical protein